MNRYKNGLKSVYNGLMPTSQIKGTLITLVGLYLVFLIYHVKDNLGMQREVKVENVQQGGTVLMNGTKYAVPYSKTSALIPLQIDDPAQFLLVSSGDMDESLFSALLKISTCILLLKLLWQINLNDPFSPEHYKLANTLAWLGAAIIITAYFKEYYTAEWFKRTYHYASGFKYNWSYGLFYLIPAIWIWRTITSFYITAVKTRHETELTI